jgi:hypothetical protein
LSRFAEGLGLDYKQERSSVDFAEAGKKGDGEAGGGDGIAGGFTTNLMESGASEAAVKQAIEGLDTEGQKRPAVA